MSIGLMLATSGSLPVRAQHDCQSSKHGGSAGLNQRDVPLWPWDILHQRITLDLTLGNIIRGACDITCSPRSDGATELPLQLLALTVDSVIMNGQTVPFTHTGIDLAINLPASFNTTDTLTLTVHYGGDPVLDPSGFGGFYTTGQYSYNLGVAFESVPHSYGRAWFPCADNFTERNTYEFIVTTTAAWSAWCNGELIDEWQPTPATRTRHWAINETMPAYLASVSASNYAVVRDTLMSTTGAEIPVTLVAKPADTTNMKNSFINLQAAFDRFEEWFGPYRWNRVGYVLTPQGAMEHSTSIHYPQSIANGSLSYQDIMAHELAHHWFGNLVTCERAEEMYINEGFAEYLAYLFIEAIGGTTSYMNKVRGNHRNMLLRAHIDDEGWWALADMPQEWTYGKHTYNKGADVLHTLRSYMGDEAFREGLTSFLEAYAFQHVNSSQLRAHLESVTGIPLTDYFQDWILQPGWAAFEADSFVVQDPPIPSGPWPTTVHVQQKHRGPANDYHNVPISLTFMDVQGNTWTDPVAVLVGDATCTVESAPPFFPKWAFFNADERLSLAQTFDTDSFTGPATRIYTNADLRITVNSTPGPFTIRMEEYWVAADPQVEEAFAYVVSPDRYWRIIGSMPEAASLSGRFAYDGRPAPAISFDPGLMQDFNGITFREDSMVLLYRPDAHWPWTPHPDQTLNTQGSATDRIGRIDINGLRAGEYCFAWRKSAVGITEPHSSNATFTIQPNPASEVVTIRTSEPVQGLVELYDARGRLVRWEPINGEAAVLRVAGLKRGSYILRHKSVDGRSTFAGKMVVE
ncbi:MAG: T9SS type A sorting domain-containing protein [Flavobacteriales bacterium]|nr:T9SS type A sorting domain-containing protein [Flavobacteriales bacterium]